MIQKYRLSSEEVLSQIKLFKYKSNEYSGLSEKSKNFQDEINKTYDLIEEYIEDFESSYSDSERGDNIKKHMEICKSELQQIQVAIGQIIDDVAIRKSKYENASAVMEKTKEEITLEGALLSAVEAVGLAKFDASIDW